MRVKREKMQLSDENDLRGRNMVTFLMEKLNIVFDGVLQPHEIVAAIAAVLLVAAVIGVAIALIMKTIRDVNPRKSTIFSHRKNKYKSRIGKNNKKYM